MDTSIFFLNAKDASDVLLNRGEWILSHNLTSAFLEELRLNKYKVAFVKKENIFSHGMNVLRKVLFGINTIAVVGSEGIFNVLQDADECRLSIDSDMVTVGEKSYKFREFSFLRDTSEIIEYNTDTEEICYKPDYYYSDELSPIIVKGYNMSQSMLPASHSSRCDDDGRIWNKGFAFPFQFFDYFSANRERYFANLLKYIGVLGKIYSLRYLETSSHELRRALTEHYSYSIIFSLITPNICEVLKSELGDTGIEKTYNLFVVNSPIHNKENLTEVSLEKMKKFLENILNGAANNENYFNLYHAYGMPSNDIALMYFVTNMFSDIRRCVINVIIENNSWFGSICHHREKAKIY